MECACIYVESYDGPEAFRAVTRKARKEHTCCECKQVIQPFEEYRYESGIWDSKPNSYKTCAACISVRDEMFCEGYMFTELWHDVREYIQESGGSVSTKCLMNLKPLARDKVMAIMDEVFYDNE